MGLTLCSIIAKLFELVLLDQYHDQLCWDNIGLCSKYDIKDPLSSRTYIKSHVFKACTSVLLYLWSPYVIGQTIILLPCDFYLLLSSFFLLSSPNLSRRRLDVCHTSTHGVALVRI